jgi:SmpA/OmlA family protein
MRRIAFVGVMVLAAACKPAAPPGLLQQYQSRSLVTCCNIHYEGDEVTDANYFVGATIPPGTAVQVQSMTGSSVTFTTAEGKKLTLAHSYGKDQESIQQYVDKMLVASDPKARAATFPRSAQQAIHEGRVEKGMTREQVIMSLGYPPTHRTASTSATEWTYWYNRWVTYKVEFDGNGLVANVIGRPAPTQDQPIQPDPKPATKAAPKGKGKKRH